MNILYRIDLKDYRNIREDECKIYADEKIVMIE
jgi:hypothetical protein